MEGFGYTRITRTGAVIDCLLIVATFAWTTFGLLPEVAAGFRAYGFSHDSATAWASVVAFLPVGTIAVCITLGRRLSWKSLGLSSQSLRPSLLLVGVAVGVVAVIVGQATWYGVHGLPVALRAIGVEGATSRWLTEAPQPDTMPWTMVIVFTLATTFTAELALRGVLLPRLRRITGGWAWAVVVSAGLYGLVGWWGGASSMLSYAATAVVLCIAFIQTRDLAVPVIASVLHGLVIVALHRA